METPSFGLRRHVCCPLSVWVSLSPRSSTSVSVIPCKSLFVTKLDGQITSSSIFHGPVPGFHVHLWTQARSPTNDVWSILLGMVRGQNCRFAQLYRLCRLVGRKHHCWCADPRDRRELQRLCRCRRGHHRIGTLVVGLFCYKFVHEFEQFAWIPALISFLVLLGVSAKNLASIPMGTGQVEAASVLSFGGSIFGFTVSWSSLSSDYNVYMPHDAKPWKVFSLDLSRYLGSLHPHYVVGCDGRRGSVCKRRLGSSNRRPRIGWSSRRSFQ